MIETFKAGAAIVHLQDEILFEHIDKKLWVSGPIKKLVNENGKLNLEDRLIKKISEIISRVQFILKMYPREDTFVIHFVKNKEEVSSKLYEIAGIHCNQKAVYSIKHNTVIASVKNLKVYILVHEIAHAFIKMYFKKSVPGPIQELLAQYVVDELNNRWLK